jgi:integrase
VLSDTPRAVDFISFLKTFWNWDNSSYIKEKLRKNHGIHKQHCIIQGQAIDLYWKPFFEGRFLGEIMAADIDAFINHMGEKFLSASRKNVVSKAGTKPIRWAFAKGLIDKDPTRGHTMFSGEEKERIILTPTAAAAAFRAGWEDNRAKLANMLAAVTGMRCGEIQALRFQDLGPDCVYVRASWNKADGLKTPKNNEKRTVEVPFPDLMNWLVELARRNPWGVSPDSFIFWNTTKKEEPVYGHSFVVALREILVKIGFSEKQAAKYLFHGWRHFFISYMIGKVDKKLLKGQTGHKTDKVFFKYGDHAIEGDREAVQAMEREVFAGMLPKREPQKVLLLEYKGEPNTAAVET